MTIDKPGQEQRMVTDAMIEAGATVIEEKARFFDEQALAKMVYTAMHEARPTADLGEDGELIERLGLHRSWRDSHGELNDAPNEARDRLILYREALEVVAREARLSADAYGCANCNAAAERARDVLSRSA